jgi:hypothetical protein
MEDFDLIGPNGTDINNEFLKAYRDSLRNQYDANVSSYKQQKRNADAQIMSAANKAGMMYSNFPQRSKIQTEADYLTGLSKLRGTYQTGLDKLRNNAVDAYNQIKAYEEAISDLKGAGGGSGGSGGGTGGTGDNGNPSTTGNTDGNNPSNTIQGDYDLIEHIPMNKNAGTSSNKSTFWQDVANSQSIGSDQTWQRRAGAAAGRLAGTYLGGTLLGPLGGLLGAGLGGKIGDELTPWYNR